MQLAPIIGDYCKFNWRKSLFYDLYNQYNFVSYYFVEIIRVLRFPPTVQLTTII
jgi:hypothetical protein